jgi:hypothetical protein
MKDTILFLLTVAVMIGGAVASANKKKKEAARKASRQAERSERPETPMKPATYTAPKSIGELLEELARGDAYEELQQESADAETDYFDEEMSTLAAEEESATARLAKMTYTPMRPDSVERNTKKVVEETPAMEELREAIDESQNAPIDDILADFDLRRAVIESEILTPKYQQY